MSTWNNLGAGPNMNGKPSTIIMSGMEMAVIISSVQGDVDENDVLADRLIRLLDADDKEEAQQ